MIICHDIERYELAEHCVVDTNLSQSSVFDLIVTFTEFINIPFYTFHQELCRFIDDEFSLIDKKLEKLHMSMYISLNLVDKKLVST